MERGKTQALKGDAHEAARGNESRSRPGPAQVNPQRSLSLTPDTIVALQRTVGNATVSQLLAAQAEGLAARRPLVVQPTAAMTPARGAVARGATLDHVAPEYEQQMDEQRRTLTARWHNRLLPLSDSEMFSIQAAIDDWFIQGIKDREAGLIKHSSTYVDRFIIKMMTITYDRGAAITEWTSGWDDFLEKADPKYVANVRQTLRTCHSQYADYSPAPDPDKPNFWREVGSPVFFNATSMLSFGIVDEQLFDDIDRLTGNIWAGQENSYLLLANYLADRITMATANFFTLGGAQAYFDYAKDHPESTFKERMEVAAAAPFPWDEAKRIYNWASDTRDPDSGEKVDKWQAMQAFWSGVMKVIALLAAAKGARDFAKGRGFTITRDQLREMVKGDKGPVDPLSSGGDKGRLARQSGKLGGGVFVRRIAGVDHPVVVKIIPDGDPAIKTFDKELAGARAAAKAGFGPKVYGEVKVDGGRAFAMDAQSGGFITEDPDATEAQKAESAKWAKEVNGRTLSDLARYRDALWKSGHYYSGEFQTFVDKGGALKPIDFAGISKLPEPPGPTADRAAVDQYERDLSDAWRQHNSSFDGEAKHFLEQADANGKPGVWQSAKDLPPPPAPAAAADLEPGQALKTAGAATGAQKRKK